MSRRDAIRMSEDEVLAFLEQERTVVCATNGVRGWPHLMPLWYVLRPTGPGGAAELWAWTFAKSQKAKNLERDPRATLQVEAGERYEELRGLMLRTEAAIHRDDDTKRGFVAELAERYAPPGVEPEAVRAGFEAQIPKRVALEFRERDRVSWDHRKLGGTY
jgi:nitroimidazol reductase NimA-like FMN-containing flavoprotein (pyridoxamine 5'-phosphate oxidase superfamily)